MGCLCPVNQCTCGRIQGPRMDHDGFVPIMDHGMVTRGPPHRAFCVFDPLPGVITKVKTRMPGTRFTHSIQKDVTSETRQSCNKFAVTTPIVRSRASGKAAPTGVCDAT